MEVFLDSPAGAVTSGGTDAPASGTVETLTVTVTAAFAAASASAVPPTWFHVVDPYAPSEVMLVTAAPGGTGTGQSWTVTRGADGTTPVTHATGFAIAQVTPAGFLANAQPWVGMLTSGSIDSTTPAVISPSYPVAANTSYVAHAWMIIDANAGGTAEFRWTGPAASLTIMGLTCQENATLDAYPASNSSNGAGYNTGFIDTQELGAAFYICELWLTLTTTAAGDLALECANLAGASDAPEIYAGGWLEVKPAFAA